MCEALTAGVQLLVAVTATVVDDGQPVSVGQCSAENRAMAGGPGGPNTAGCEVCSIHMQLAMCPWPRVGAAGHREAEQVAVGPLARAAGADNS